MLGDPENQFSVTRRAPSASGRTKTTFRSVALLLLFNGILSVLGLGCSTATPRQPDPLQKAWEAAVAKGFSGGAMVVVGNRTRFFEVRSSASAKEFAIRKNTPLPICSVTKAMTAEIVFDLIDEGKLARDGTLKTQLPWIPPFAENITLRQLLTHTSGLRNMDKALGEDTNGVSRIYQTFDESWRPLQSRILGIIGNEVAAPAGTKYDYNNADFLILQAVAERASGQTLAKLLQNHVFGPAGMRHSLLAPWNSAKTPFVDCYAVEGGKETRLDRFNMGIYGGAAGVLATPEDLVQWMKFMVTQPAGRKIVLGGSQFGGFQGFGGYAYRSSFIRKQLSLPGDELVFERPGAVNGYTLQISFLPERGVAAAAFSNRAGEKLGSVYEGTGLVADLIAAAGAGLSAPSRQ